MRTARNIALAAAVATMACDSGSPACGVSPTWNWDSDSERLIGPPDLDMLAGDTVKTFLADWFGPSECLEGFLADYGDSLFAARSSDPAAVAVSATGTVLTTIAIDAADSVLVDVGPEILFGYRDDGCIRRPGSRCRPSGHFHFFYVSVARRD